MSPKLIRVCVVGAGPSGLSVLYHLNKMKGCDSNIASHDDNVNIDVVCYEKHSTMGGLWNMSWRVGTELGGEVVHSSMYHHLWTNAPKEALEYDDYPFAEHFNVNVPSYLPRTMILDYMKGRMMKYGDLNEYIKYNTKVTHVDFDEATKKFNVQVSEVENHGEQDRDEVFDYVIVATGHFWAPNFPEFQGIETFPGRILHSHDYKSAKEFKGNRVLVVGGSYSADDISVQCMKFGAKSVAISSRRPTGLKWGAGYSEYPLLTKIDDNKVYFENGKTAEVDAIILATGYLHSFPFVRPELRMKPENVYYPTQLYKGIVFVGGGNNQMMYLGMQNQAFSFPMFDAQASWSLLYIMGSIKIPERADIIENIKKWTDRESQCKGVNDIIDLQNDYILELHKDTGHEFQKFYEYRNLLKKWIVDKFEKNLYTFRDQNFKSVVSGVESTVNKTPFMDNFDDTMEGILSQMN